MMNIFFEIFVFTRMIVNFSQLYSLLFLQFHFEEMQKIRTDSFKRLKLKIYSSMEETIKKLDQ